MNHELGRQEAEAISTGTEAQPTRGIDTVDTAVDRWDELTGDDNEISKDIAWLLTEAVTRGASDIRLCTEPHADETVVTARLRINGELEIVNEWLAQHGSEIIDRFRSVGLADASEPTTADRQFDVAIPKTGRYTLRLLLMPLRDGKVLTIRLRDPDEEDFPRDEKGEGHVDV